MKKSLSLFLAVVMLLSVMTAALPTSAGALTWYEYWHGSNQPIIDKWEKYNYKDERATYENGILFFTRPHGYPYGKKDESKDTEKVEITIEYVGNTERDGNFKHTFKNVKTHTEYDNSVEIKPTMDEGKWPSGVYTFEAVDPVHQIYWEGDSNDWYKTRIIATRRMVGTFVYQSPYSRLDMPSHLRWEGKVSKWEPVYGAEEYLVKLYNKDGYNRRTIHTTDTWWDFTDASLTIQDGDYFTVTASTSKNQLDSFPATSTNKQSYTLNFYQNIGGGSYTPVSGLSGNYVLPKDSKGYPEPEGKVFVGWALDQFGNQMVTSINMDANKNVYAIWKTTSSALSSDVYWNLEDGKLTIYGNGAIPNYAESGSGQSPFRNNTEITSIYIADGITKIGDYAFIGCSNVKNVYLENALELTSIGSGSFKNCSALKRIQSPCDLSADIRMINASAFEYCSSLRDFKIPDNVEYIVANAFNGCSALQCITIPAGVSSISEDAFNNCHSLKEVFYGGSKEDWNKITIKKNNDPIKYATVHEYSRGALVGNYAYYIADVYGQNATITGTGTTFDYEEVSTPVKSMQVDNITIEKGIITIGNNLFNDCDAILTVTIADTVKTIGKAAFYNCDGLAKIKLPDSITQIGNAAFDDCDNLASINIGSGLTSIGPYAFYTCPKLEKIYYNGLRKQFNDISVSAYNHSFTEAEFCSVSGACGDNASFSFDTESGTLTISGTGAMNNYATNETGSEPPWYNYRDEIDAVVIEEGITTVGRCAFIRSGIKSVTIPDTVTKLFGSCFMECLNLENIVLPDSITQMDTSVLYLDSGLKNVVIPANIKEIPNFFVAGCTSLKQLYLPEGITTIGIYAFRDCTSLEAINIPDSVVKIDDAFEGASDTLTVYASCDNALVQDYIISGTNRTWYKTHQYPTNASKSVKATSTALGYKQYNCSKCSEAYKSNFTAPTGKLTLKHSGRNATAVKVSWNNVKSATGYQVQVSNKAANKWDTYATLKAGTTVYTFKKLASGNNYKFRVRFYIKAADGKNYYSPWSKTLNSPTCPSDTTLTKLTPAKKAFTAQWKKNGAVNGYQVQYSLKSNFSGAKTVTVKSNKTLKTTVKKLNAKKVYFVRIRTYKTISKVNYFSTWSKTYKVKTK